MLQCRGEARGGGQEREENEGIDLGEPQEEGDGDGREAEMKEEEVGGVKEELKNEG